MDQHCQQECSTQASLSSSQPEATPQTTTTGTTTNQEQTQEQESCERWAAAGYCNHVDYLEYMKQHCVQSCSTANQEANAHEKKTHVQESSPPEKHETEDDGYGDEEATCGAEADSCQGEGETTGNDESLEDESASEEDEEEDEEPEMCASWVKLGYCVAGTHVEYMQRTCARSCAAATEAGTAPDSLYQAPSEECRKWADSGACSNHNAYMMQHCIGYCDEDGEAVPPEIKPPSTITSMGSMLLLGGFAYAAFKGYKFAVNIDADRSLLTRRQTNKVLHSDHEAIGLGLTALSRRIGSAKRFGKRV